MASLVRRLEDARSLLDLTRERIGRPPHLNGVRFIWHNNLRSTVAQVDIDTRIIELSRPILTLPGNDDDELFRDVILHELAHLLTGETIKHGRAWREWFQHIGGSGNRLYSNLKTSKGKPARIM